MTNRLRQTALVPRPIDSAAVQQLHDQVDPLRVPALHRLMVGADRGAQPAPTVEVPARHRMDQAAGADDPAQHVTILRDAVRPTCTPGPFG